MKKRLILRACLLAVILIGTGVWFMANRENYEYRSIKNPIYYTGNDPWVVKHQGSYYYCWSDSGIRVRKIDNLDDIKTVDGVQVWKPEKGTMHSEELWAPELHYIDGAWYVYVAACDGPNENHRMYVLKGTTQDPTDPFEFVGQVTDSTNRWAIDGTVMRRKGELYFIWSGWEGSVDVGQQLYIAHMSDPTTIDSERVQISAPSYSWEMTGLPIEEGPFALTSDEHDTAIIVFSASGSWTDDYCLGKLTLTGNDPMDPASWTKHETPIFSKEEGSYGPGHCSFVEADDGTTWMVYHCNTVSGSGWGGRTCRTQPIQWDGKTLELGKPVSTSEWLQLPVLTKK